LFQTFQTIDCTDTDEPKDTHAPEPELQGSRREAVDRYAHACAQSIVAYFAQELEVIWGVCSGRGGVHGVSGIGIKEENSCSFISSGDTRVVIRDRTIDRITRQNHSHHHQIAYRLLCLYCQPEII